MPSLQKNKFELNPALVFFYSWNIITIFIVIPVLLILYYHLPTLMVQFPDFTFLLNYINLTQDPILCTCFAKYLTLAIVVGPIIYRHSSCLVIKSDK